MVDSVQELVNRREQIWDEIKEKRKGFDDDWRKHNENHNCSTKVYAYNGEWFCEHLTRARDTQFKSLLQEEEKIELKILTCEN